MSKANMPDIELKPCPWCKAIPKIKPSSHNYFMVVCVNDYCPAEMPQTEGKTTEIAVNKWNSRPSDESKKCNHSLPLTPKFGCPYCDNGDHLKHPYVKAYKKTLDNAIEDGLYNDGNVMYDHIPHIKGDFSEPIVGGHLDNGEESKNTGNPGKNETSGESNKPEVLNCGCLSDANCDCPENYDFIDYNEKVDKGDEVEELAKRLHNAYLISIAWLKRDGDTGETGNFNPNAVKLYEELTEEQRHIDRHIAKIILEEGYRKRSL